MLSVLLVLRTQEGIDEQVGSARGDRGVSWRKAEWQVVERPVLRMSVVDRWMQTLLTRRPSQGPRSPYAANPY